MKRCSVLIADDELIIRRGLSTLLAKDPCFNIVGEAEDGELAIAMCKNLEPEIAFVDINMPFLDGLACIEQLKKVSPATIVIVISGYDEFEYARKAIELAVFAYLLKPVQESKFFEILEEVKQALQLRQEQQTYLCWVQEQLSKNKESLVDYFLQSLLAGNYEEQEIQQELKYLSLQIPDAYSLILLKVIHTLPFLDESVWSDALWFFAVKDLAIPLFPEQTLYHRNGSSEIVLLCKELPVEKCNYLLVTLQEQLLEKHSVKALYVYTQGKGALSISENFVQMQEQLLKQEQLPKAVIQAQKFLADHFWQNTLSLSVVADHVQVTSQHLSRLFKSYLNVTFVEYLTTLRVKEALILFKDPEKKVYEVAEQVGYSSQHYFCTAFKRVLHLSPQEYRKTQGKGILA